MNKPVLLALSTFRRDIAEIEEALATCEETNAPLVAVFVVDINLARYFADSGVMAGTSLREEMEKGIMDEHKAEAQEALDLVAKLAAERNLPCRTEMRVGRFAVEVRDLVEQIDPAVLILTRAGRPDWLRKLFGSPVDRLCEELQGKCEIRIVRKR
ncbi:MAG: universal stress protein [Armatimonadetes bacterium]|nr:universal stress protein [Armatimonadota bacterium]